MKLINWLTIIVLILSVIWFINYPDSPDENYNETEFKAVSAFLLYQRRETEVTYNYCRSFGYSPKALVTEFNRLNEAEIKRADDFIYSLNPMQRFSFRREINRVFDEMRPQLLAQIEKTYDENKRVFAMQHKDFSQKDFCRWLDENAASLLKQKTYLEVSD